MMKKAATIILNRNLPQVTDRLYEHLVAHDGDQTDIFVVEAGSDPEKLSRHASWHASWPEAREHGLRYCRGMNYGLSQLWKDKTFGNYDAFFLLTVHDHFNEDYFASINAVYQTLSQSGEKRITLIHFPTLEAMTCWYHPTLADHKTLADQLSAYIDAHPEVWQGK